MNGTVTATVAPETTPMIATGSAKGTMIRQAAGGSFGDQAKQSREAPSGVEPL